jgi:hypothetical protein
LAIVKRCRAAVPFVAALLVLSISPASEAAPLVPRTGITAAPLTVKSKAAPSPTTGYVAATGTELTVNGQPWKFAGYNLPCANSIDLAQSGSLDYWLNDIQTNSSANVIRVFFFQSEGGPGNWAPFDEIISALQARGMRAIVTLANATSTCDEPNPPNPLHLYKTVQWYQGGYKVPYGGYPLSFQAYATAVAQHYANNPAVAFWQLINEASAPSYDSYGNLICPNDGFSRGVLRNFSDTMTAAIDAVDPNHLVDLGTLSTGACGLRSDYDYTYVHAGRLGLCEYHDYGHPATAMPSALAGIVSDCHSLGKPVYIGESGIPANVDATGNPSSSCDPWPSCSPNPITDQSLQQRADFFSAKIAAANQAGVAGYVMWEKSPYYTPSTDAYSIPDGDPTTSVLSQALQNYP